MSKNSSTRRRLDYITGEDEPVDNPHKKSKSANNANNSSAVTPESGIGKFLTKTRHSKPKAARALVTPQKSKEKDASSDYQSGEEEVLKLTHIHANLDYYSRGDLALKQETMKAYQFIRDHFHIPTHIEGDHKFGPLSGSCFEEIVIRAYCLGDLEPKDGREKSDLLVCTYCGEEGHTRGDCGELL